MIYDRSQKTKARQANRYWSVRNFALEAVRTIESAELAKIAGLGNMKKQPIT